MKTAAVILAAGRGSRMRDLTADKPKCLVQLAGKSLLAWQLEALRKAGAGEILVIKGYKAEEIQGNFQVTQNPRWRETNMLSTLLCADEFAKKFFGEGGEQLVVSYSDIVYSPDHVCQLLKAQENIAITYDADWEALWRLRFTDPLSDAETFMQKDGKLLEIGGKTQNMADVQGQYMGLMSFNAVGWNNLTEVCTEMGATTDKTDMTAFLRILLKKGVAVGAVRVAGKWCEADSGEDIALYEQAMRDGDWGHDWRLEK